jgi:hypothetical protein
VRRLSDEGFRNPRARPVTPQPSDGSCERIRTYFDTVTYTRVWCAKKTYGWTYILRAQSIDRSGYKNTSEVPIGILDVTVACECLYIVHIFIYVSPSVGRHFTLGIGRMKYPNRLSDINGLRGKNWINYNVNKQKYHQLVIVILRTCYTHDDCDDICIVRSC